MPRHRMDDSDEQPKDFRYETRQAKAALRYANQALKEFAKFNAALAAWQAAHPGEDYRDHRPKRQKMLQF